MKIRYGMILAAGLGKRMQPLTLTTPKPLLKIGSKNLLERAIDLLIQNGVEEITINVHHLGDQIKKFIEKKRYKIKVSISDETKMLLDTGGGILKGTSSLNDNEPFIVINPDTLWSNEYSNDLKNLIGLYAAVKKPSLLVVDKRFSFDQSFQGDFELLENLISKSTNNQYIFTGLQIINRGIFSKENEKVFPMNKIWSQLIKEKKLFGVQSMQDFYHLNTLEMYKKTLKLVID